MSKKIRLYRLFACLGLSVLTLNPIILWAKEVQRSFLLTIPLLMVAKESVSSVEVNLENKLGLSFDFTNISNRTYLTPSEQKLRPADEMAMSGQELSLMLAKYTNPQNLSGFYFGLGAGYRKTKGSWYRSRSNDGFALLDAKGRSHHYLEAEGSTVSSRIGYRFVGSQIAGVFGIYLNLRHFNGAVKATTKNTDTLQSELEASHRDSLKRRMTTALLPGFEFGWAF